MGFFKKTVNSDGLSDLWSSKALSVKLMIKGFGFYTA